MKYTQFVFKTEMCSNLIKIKKRTVNNCKSKKYSQNTQKKNSNNLFIHHAHICVTKEKSKCSLFFK